MDRTAITIDKATAAQLRKVQLRMSADEGSSMTLDDTVQALINLWRETNIGVVRQ